MAVGQVDKREYKKNFFALLLKPIFRYLVDPIGVRRSGEDVQIYVLHL